jgi:outer membrane protein assembly factor BamB
MIATVHAKNSGFWVLAVLWTANICAAAGDWPGFRGPNGDGTVARLPETWTPPRLVWRQPVAGECHAGMAVARAVLVTPEHNEKEDFYRCRDALTGVERWVRRFANGREMEYGAGPRTNPLILGERVFVLSAFGELYCLDLKTGRTLWEKGFRKDFGVRGVPTWGFCGSPIFAGGKLILHPKDVVALDPNTGRLLWEGKASGPNYSTPIAGTFGGVEQVITFDTASLGGWDLATGARLWNLPVAHDRGYIVPSPLKVGPHLLIAPGDEDAQRLGFKAEGRIDPKPLATSDTLESEVPTATVAGERILAAAPGLVLLDAKTLRPIWTSGKERLLRDDLHIVVAGDRALAFNTKGYAVLQAIKPERLEILGSEKLCEKTLMHPSFAGGCIYVRDAKTVYCYRIVDEVGP